MSAGDTAGRSITRVDGDRSPTFERPAELVEISERIFRRVFLVGLFVVAGFTAVAVLASLLQPAGSRLLSFGICLACLPPVALAALHPGALYDHVRRQPWTLVIPATLLGIGAAAVGTNNLQLFLPMVTVIGVIGVAAPVRVVAVAALIAAAGLSAPPLLDGRNDLAGAVAVLVPPVMFWLIVDRIAEYALRFHQNMTRRESAARRLSDDPGRETAAGATASPANDPPRRQLPEPAVIRVGDKRLTSRQLQVLLLACEGLRHVEIGACLGIGPQQVGRHLREARTRTGSDTTAQLVAWALRTDLAPSPSPGSDPWARRDHGSAA